MRPSTIISLLVMGIGLIIIQAVGLDRWVTTRTAIQVPLLFMLITAAQAEWRLSLVLALVFGLLWSMFSALPSWVYPIAWVMAAAATWFIRHRIIKVRTSISLLLSVAGGTMAYYTTVAACIMITRLGHPAAVTPEWPIWLTAVAIQIIVHPLVAGGWWWGTGQRRAALHVQPIRL